MDHELFAFFTTGPNAEVGAVPMKAMAAILTKPEEWDVWLRAPSSKAKALLQPLPTDYSTGWPNCPECATRAQRRA